MSTFGGRLQRESFLERHHFLTFACVAALGLGLTTLSIRRPEAVAPVQGAGMRLFGPIAKAGASASGAAEGVMSGIGATWKARAELETLRGELDALRLVSSERDALAEENAKLRDVLDLKERVPLRVAAARIIYHERGPDWLLMIDRGTEAGIAPDQAVIAPEGVVGKVLTAQDGLSLIQCVVDGDAGIAVRVGVAGRQADAVVTDGSGDTVKLRHVDLLKDVQVGDAVVTSGMDLIYPSGLLVGMVTEVDEPGIDREIVVQPAVDFSRLDHVLVILSTDAATAKAQAERRAGEAKPAAKAKPAKAVGAGAKPQRSEAKPGARP